MSDLTLSAAELKTITGREKYRAQGRALTCMGVEWRPRPDGFPLVLRAHFETFMGHHAPTKRQPEPNWKALEKTAA